MERSSKCDYAKMGTAWLCVYCETVKLTECVNATERVKIRLIIVDTSIQSCVHDVFMMCSWCVHGTNTSSKETCLQDFRVLPLWYVCSWVSNHTMVYYIILLKYICLTLDSAPRMCGPMQKIFACNLIKSMYCANEISIRP